MGQLRDKVVSGAFWVTIERAATQAVDFIVGVVLARLLGPSDFGTVALTGIFFVLARSLIDSGLGMALVQRKDADDLDFNTVFYTSIVLSLTVYVVLFFAAPWIAAFFHTPELVPIVRVSAISLIFFGINSVQTAELERKLLFNRECAVTLIVCVVGGISGITFAFLGWGPWALVWSGVLTAFIGTIARWLIIAWRPRLEFSFPRLKGLFSFGWKMCLSGMLNQFFEQLRGLLIGRFYQRADLALVDKGGGLPQRVMQSINETLGAVAFPALVRMQDDHDRMRDAMRRMIRASSFFVIPAMVGVAFMARPLILFLFGPKWEAAVPYMQIACFSYALYPFHTVNLRGILAMGRSDLYLTLEIVKKVATLIVMLSSIRFGVLAFVAASAFVLGPFGLAVNAWPNRKLLNYTLSQQLWDVLPTILTSGVMLVFVALLDWGVLMVFPDQGSAVGYLVRLLLAGSVGIVAFLGLSWFFKVSALQEYVGILSSLLRKVRPSLGDAFERRMRV